ncbi:hypothetical protein DFH07DRAFT_831141 [Mycena maculata]|uniref:Uncharacterized protein n=1 Tax=Mycena maculata TaxID=230809 RepID=A0AAD7N799_9AGAR|nr:hypothetical protein DFH07DRAFT_831141 [Mycena maculata]
MPWEKRADGTWGNVAVEAPVILSAPDSEEEGLEGTPPDIKSTVAARAAQFQAAKLPPSIPKHKKPTPPAERMTPAPPYAPAFPPRRTAVTPSHENDDPEPATELDKIARFEPKPIRPRVVSSGSELLKFDHAAEEEHTGIRRPPPPIPRIPSRPSLVPSHMLSVDSRLSLPPRKSSPAPPLPSRQSSQSTPPLPSRQSAQSVPPLPSRPSQSTPPLPPRSTPSAPPLPSRSTFSFVDETELFVGEEEPLPVSGTPSSASSTRNPNLRPPPTRTKSSSSTDRTNTTPSWSSSKTGFAKGKAVEMARNRRNCLNPPPSCFSREPPPPSSSSDGKGIQITYAPLPAPIILRSPNSNDLAKAITTGRAFPNKPPPLFSHDVQREDWDKLWDDIDETARIEMRASAGLSVATLPLMPIFGAGLVVSTVAERKMRAGRVGPTCKLVEAWNINFFRPRRLDVYIAQNSFRLSGPTPTQASRKTIDPAFLKWQQATDAMEKQLAMKEYEKWEGKFRFVVQSWPTPKE